MLPALEFYEANGTDGKDLSKVTAVYIDASGREIRQAANLPAPTALPPTANQRALALLDIINQMRTSQSLPTVSQATLDNSAAQKPANS